MVSQRAVIGGAATVALLSVALGAFGAHGLADRVDAKGLEWWDTATFYLLSHAVAALSISLAKENAWFLRSALCLLIGAGVFAVTLYLMALGAPRWLGAVTPIGGVLMISGWAAVALGAWGRR